MQCDDAAFEDADADFQRWYFGGSPPEDDGWDRHAFEGALHAPIIANGRFQGVRTEPIPAPIEAYERLLAA